MKVFDSTTLRKAARQKKGILSSFQIPSGDSAQQKEAQAQEVAISVLQKSVDNRFVMLRNVTLEGLDVPIPLILVGPPGVRVLYSSPLKGIFRATESTWEKLDGNSQRYKIAKPNLLNRTQLMARAVNAYLNSHGLSLLLEVEPILFFSNPGTHVDSIRPIVRVVQADALDRFVAGLLQSRIILEQEQIKRTVDVLLGDLKPATDQAPTPDPKDAFSFLELREEKQAPPSPIVIEDASEPNLLKRVPFSRRQLVLLSLMTLVDIVIIIVFVVLVLLYS